MTAWLDRLAQQLGLDPSLVQAIHRALSAEFRDLTGEDVADYELVPPLVGQPLRWSRFAPPAREGERLIVEGELIHAGWSFPVRLSWSVEEPLSPRWEELPADDILFAVAERRAIALPPDLSFPVEVGDPVWPHVRLIVSLASPFTPEQAHALGDRLRDLSENWPADQGAFHRMAVTPAADALGFDLRVDFGSTGDAALHALLRTLADTGLAVTRVRLDMD